MIIKAGKSIFFRSNGVGKKGHPLTIQCLVEEKVSELIQRYRTKANDHDKLK